MLLKNLTNKILEKDNTLPDNYFAHVLSLYDKKPQVIRTPLKEDSYIHSSSLSGFCARRAALLLYEGRAPVEYVTGAHKLVWALGRAAEEYVRTGLLESLGKENFFGNWSCKCGHTTVTGASFPKHIKCEVCKTAPTKYMEYSVYDDSLRLVGNPDLIYICDGILHVIEIKSIKKASLLVNGKSKQDGFEDLASPVEAHAKQSSRYVYMLRKLGHKVAKHTTVIYVAKDFFWGQPYKEFKVDTSLPRYRVSYEEEIEQVLKYSNAIKDNTMPVREFCKDIFSPIAKKCPACNSCFSSPSNES